MPEAENSRPPERSRRFCQSKGIRVIAGECPFMFLPNAGFPHSWHRFIKQAMGSYPR